MSNTGFGVGLVLFTIYAAFGFATEAFEAMFGIALGSAFAFGGGTATEVEAAGDLTSNALMAGLSAIATLFGLVLVFRRSRSAPAFWSVMLILVALIHLYEAFAFENGLYAITLAIAAAGWQIFWLHSSNVERVFGTKGFGW